MRATPIVLVILLSAVSARAEPANPAYLERLHAQAQRASERGDCDRVIEIAAEVRQIDATYLESVLLADPVVMGCRDAPRPEPEPEPDRPRPTRSSRYARSILSVDAVAILLVVADSFVDGDAGDAMTFAGISTYVVGPMIVHGRRRNDGKAAGSFGLRLGLPVLGGIVGIPLGATRAECGEGCDGSGRSLLEAAGEGALVGLAIGALTAMVIDWSVLAKTTVPITITPRSDSAMVGLAGAF